MRYVFTAILCVLLGATAWAGTWTLKFVPADSTADVTGSTLYGTATATWAPATPAVPASSGTPAVPASDPSGINHPFQVTAQIDAKSTADQQAFMALCRQTWAHYQQVANGALTTQLTPLLTNGAAALNASAEH